MASRQRRVARGAGGLAGGAAGARRFGVLLALVSTACSSKPPVPPISREPAPVASSPARAAPSSGAAADSSVDEPQRLTSDRWFLHDSLLVGIATDARQGAGLAFVSLDTGRLARFVPLPDAAGETALGFVDANELVVSRSGKLTVVDTRSSHVRELVPRGNLVDARGGRIVLATDTGLSVVDASTDRVEATVVGARPPAALGVGGTRLAAIWQPTERALERVGVFQLPDGKRLLTAKPPAPTRPGLPTSVSAVALDAKGETLLFGVANEQVDSVKLHELGGEVVVVDLASRHERHQTLPMRPDRVWFSADGRLIGSYGSGDNWQVPGRVRWVAATGLAQQDELTLRVGETATVAADGSVLTSYQGAPEWILGGPGERARVPFAGR